MDGLIVESVVMMMASMVKDYRRPDQMLKGRGKKSVRLINIIMAEKREGRKGMMRKNSGNHLGGSLGVLHSLCA